MNFAVYSCIIIAVLSVLTQQQQIESKGAIDSFELGSDIVIFTLPINVQLPNEQVSIYTDPAANPVGLIGGERDLALFTTQGLSGRTMSSSVGGGTWVISTPIGASGYVLLQLDGKDNSINLNKNGLNPRYDATVGGVADRFNITLGTDLATVVTITAYTSGGDCSINLSIPAGSSENPAPVFLPFNSANSTCSFTSIGAIELVVQAFENVDATVSFFGVSGLILPTPTPTSTHSASPTGAASRVISSASNTVTPGATPTATTSKSPTATPEPVLCACRCPAFTCALAFDPDDDENDAYYFDDDDDGLIDSQAVVASSASTLSLSLATFVIAMVSIY